MNTLANIWQEKNYIIYFKFKYLDELFDIYDFTDNDYIISNGKYEHLYDIDLFDYSGDAESSFKDLLKSNNNYRFIKFKSKINTDYIGIFIKETILPDNNYSFICIDISKRSNISKEISRSKLDSLVNYKTIHLLAQNDDLEKEINKRKEVEIELKNLNQQLESFANSVTHDLKSPLRYTLYYANKINTHINNINELINNDDILNKSDLITETTKAGKNLTTIIERIKALDNWIEDVLKLSQLDKNELILHEIDLKNSLTTIFNTAKSYHSKDAIIIFNDDFNYKIKTDYILFESIFINIFSNAIKYSYNTDISKITISVIKKDIISVKDNGIGIKPEHMEDIFKEFKRYDTVVKGSGLGLSIVKRAIEKLDGYVYVENNTDEGCTFFLNLGKENIYE